MAEGNRHQGAFEAFRLQFWSTAVCGLDRLYFLLATSLITEWDQDLIDTRAVTPQAFHLIENAIISMPLHAEFLCSTEQQRVGSIPLFPVADRSCHGRFSFAVPVNRDLNVP